MGLHLSEMERRADRGRARADRVEEGPLHGGQAGRGVHGLRHRRPGLRPLRRARGDLRAGPGARLVDDRRLLPLRREGPRPQGREHAARSTGWATRSRCRWCGWTSSGGRSTSRWWTCSRARARAAAARGRPRGRRTGGKAERRGASAAAPRLRARPRRGRRRGRRRSLTALDFATGGSRPLECPVPRSSTAPDYAGASASLAPEEEVPRCPKSGASPSTCPAKELIFLQKVTRQEYHFITDDEQEARLRLRDKLLEGFFDQNENRIVLNLTRDELLFLIKVARENYSFIVRAEKEARLALAAKLHKTAEAVFGVSSKVED